jgi:acid phosphatase (class A)
MTRFALTLSGATAALLLITPGVVLAEVSAPAAAPAATMARPAKTFKVLTPADVDPATLLSPPVADGSPRQVAELAEVRRIYFGRTPEERAHADWDNTHEDATLFATTVGPAFDLAKLPKTAAFLTLVENEQSVAANIAKRFFLRNRPWAIDPKIVSCDAKPNANAKTSFPSGHATVGYSVGYVLANLMPEKAQPILARANDYAYSRVVCGAHYPSDTEASHVLGVVVGQKLMHNPALAEQIAGVRAELKAAGLTDR